MERPLHVLLIEDDENDAELVARKLRSGGFQLTWERVERFDDARRALEAGGWDLVISDHSLPGFRSADVLGLLKGPAAPPFVIVSGAIGEHEVVDALHRGAASYVDKQSLSRLVPTIERVLAEAELRREHAATLERLELVQAAVESTDHLIFILDATAGDAPRVIFANEAAHEMTGYDEAEIVALGFAGLHGHDLDPTAVDRLLTSMLQGESVSAELLLHHKDGSSLWVETSVRPIAAGSHRYVCVSRDITERRSIEAKLAFLARHDPLTGLPNRALLDERLEREFALARRSKLPFAVMLVDIDHFKLVNDSFGHAAGDELLRTVSHRLRGCVREVDTVARLGGDEFVVMLTGLTVPDYVNEAAERVLAALREPIAIEGRMHQVSASIGIALSSPDADKSSMLREADAALYRVKAAGRNAFAF